MPDIQCLPSHVADLIAAGEVVERPASVAKELLENAIDAGSSAIVVEIQHGGLTYLRIADNGCGIDAEQLRTLFHPFHGGFAEGTGLGMSLVFQFVQGMGWDIQVDSAQGRGTTVRLLLPFAPPPA